MRLSGSGGTKLKPAPQLNKVIAICIEDDPTMAQNIISNLIKTADKVMTDVTDQIHKYLDYDDERKLWENIAGTMSEDWAKAHARVQDAAAELEKYTDPTHKPLGLIGATLDSVFVEDAQKRYQKALAQFENIDESLQQTETMRFKFQEISAEFNAAQKKKAWIEQMDAALKLLKSNDDKIATLNMRDSLSVAIPVINNDTPPTEEYLETLAQSLQQVIAALPKPPAKPQPVSPAKQLWMNLWRKPAGKTG
jgi:DNA repair ATPase RecN